MSNSQKNFLKIPHVIEEKVEHLSGVDVKIASLLHLKIEDIRNGAYAHIGMSLDKDNNLSFSEKFLPIAKAGRYSRRNRQGYVIVHRDLPMTETSYEVPNWGDWDKGSHSHTVPCYQRTQVPAKELTISLARRPELDESGTSLCLMASVDLVLSSSNSKFRNDLLFALNLLQENVGRVDVVSSAMTIAEFFHTTQVEWEIFPPGTREQDIAIITSLYKKTRSAIPSDLAERVDLLRSMQPLEIIFGNSGFSKYLGAVYAENLVVFENPEYGNAAYVLFENWKEASQLSRTQLLREREEKFIRVVHRGQWKRRLWEIVMKHLRKGPFSKAA